MRPPDSIADAFVVAVTIGLLGLLFNALFIDVFEASKIAIITWTLLGLAEKAKTFTFNTTPKSPPMLGGETRGRGGT